MDSVALPQGLIMKPSPIHGLGIFSVKSFTENEFIGDWLGVKYANRKAYEEVYGKDFRYTYYSPFPWHPVYSCRLNRNFVSYINHCDTPNVYLKRRKLYAIKAITEGEELVLKYPNKDFFG